jgi:hypothetical protein
VAGKSAGNSRAPFLKRLNLFKKSPEFESSPGHHNFLNFQKPITRYLGEFESYFHSNLRGNYR